MARHRLAGERAPVGDEPGLVGQAGDAGRGPRRVRDGACGTRGPPRTCEGSGLCKIGIDQRKIGASRRTDASRSFHSSRGDAAGPGEAEAMSRASRVLPGRYRKRAAPARDFASDRPGNLVHIWQFTRPLRPAVPKDLGLRPVNCARVNRAGCEALFQFSSHPYVTSVATPQSTRASPAAWPIQCPAGASFSTSTNTAMPAIQAIFMMPPTKSRSIRTQQHPKQ